METIEKKEVLTAFLNNLQQAIEKRSDIDFEKTPLEYKNGKYEMWRVASKDIKPDDKILMIRAGIHGEEISGPLSILENFDQIFDYAHSQGIKLIVYPAGNPSGFLNDQRYNIDNDSGDAGNNGYMYYELESGEIVDGLKSKKDFKNWYWADDEKIKAHLPLETSAFISMLKSKEPIKQIAGLIDLHQDYITPGTELAAYHYAFGDLKPYKKIIADIEKTVPIWRDRPIGAGFARKTDEEGKIESVIADEDLIESDQDGFIVRHDGTLSDVFYHLGTKYSVTSETTGATPLDKAIEVNKIWMMGMIDLVSRDKAAAE